MEPMHQELLFIQLISETTDKTLMAHGLISSCPPALNHVCKPALPQTSAIHRLSKTIVKPALPACYERCCDLTPWDLTRLPQHYIQVGFLYSHIPPALSTNDIAQSLQDSLSLALFHFYPLAGRLHVEQELDEDIGRASTCVSLNCNGEGAEFSHAIATGYSVNTMLDSPACTHGFFPLGGALNYDGRHLPLFAIQMTELADGLFLGCSCNHGVADGTSFIHFVNSWAEISRAKAAGADAKISRPPAHTRWFPEGDGTRIKLVNFKEEVRYSPPTDLQQRLFQFTPKSLESLTERANKECSSKINISSFQALSSLVWKCITRARGIKADQASTCWLPINIRLRLRPRLSRNYFGNAANSIAAAAPAKELLENSVGWGARLLNERLVAHNNHQIREALTEWMVTPELHPISASNPNTIVMVGSPRFDFYDGCDFGWGKPVGLRGGEMNKFDGLVMWWPGHQGKGSVELEICLLPEAMNALESDPEFMQFVAPPASKALNSTPLPICGRQEILHLANY